MFKLKVVAGPNRGTSYALQNGENSIGRQIGNAIVLQSTKVSKRHCLLLIQKKEVLVQDQGSINGTFVNGILSRNKKIRSGDRISVGEYVLELIEPEESIQKVAPPVVGFGKLIPFPGAAKNDSSFSGTPGTGTSTSVRNADRAPVEFKEKLIWYFEKHIMPFFYGLNFRYEWRSILVAVFALLGVGNVIISIHPLLESSRLSVIKEVTRRAQFIAKQIAERNGPTLSARSETTVEIGSIEREEGVRLVAIVDLDSRVIAPPSKLNQYLTTGGEAKLAAQAKRAFLKGRETGIALEVDSGAVAAVEPIKAYDPRLGKNVVIAMAIVSLDTTLSTLQAGEIGMIYSEALIFNGILLIFFFMIVYFLTLKPFQILNDDMDKVLKGEMNQVTHEFKLSEHNSLWDVVNSALQRIPRGSHGIDGIGMEESIQPTSEEFSAAVCVLGKISKFGLVVCDGERKVLFMNSVFEEITGIRSDASIGQLLPSLARDQAFSTLCIDLFDRAPVGGGEIAEDFEFSGIPYRIHVTAFGPAGRQAKNYVLAAERTDGEGGGF